MAGTTTAITIDPAMMVALASELRTLSGELAMSNGSPETARRRRGTQR